MSEWPNASEDVDRLTGAVLDATSHEGAGDGDGSGVISAEDTREQAPETHQSHMSLESPQSLLPRENI